MKDFAKIIKLKDRDVLLYERHTDGDDYELIVLFYNDADIEIKVTLGFKSEDERSRNLNEFSEERAQQLVKYIGMKESK